MVIERKINEFLSVPVDNIRANYGSASQILFCLVDPIFVDGFYFCHVVFQSCITTVLFL